MSKTNTAAFHAMYVITHHTLRYSLVHWSIGSDSFLATTLWAETSTLRRSWADPNINFNTKNVHKFQVLVGTFGAHKTRRGQTVFILLTPEDTCHCLTTHTHSFRMTGKFHHPESTLLFSITQCVLVLCLSVHIALTFPGYMPVSFLLCVSRFYALQCASGL